MTWNVKVVSDAVEAVPGMCVCTICKHQDGCQIPKVTGPIQDLLTGIDTRCDGSWANGDAELKCQGFEAKDADETEAPSASGRGEASPATATALGDDAGVSEDDPA